MWRETDDVAIAHGYLSWFVSFVTTGLAMMPGMDWNIERVDVAEEAVYLKKPLSGTERRFCVPGAVSAHWQADLLVIEASTGFVWEIEPYSGRRRRRAQCCFFA